MLSCHATIDPAFTIGSIDRRLFGSFIEHMGRCVYGGIFEPGHSESDADGFRGDVIALVRELGVSVVRYPGGNFVSGYSWQDGIGPVEERPRRLDLAWRSVEPNTFGLAEFMKWSTRSEIEPMMAINLGTRGVDDARDLLEYANHPSGTAWSDLRAKHGARAPYNIKLWCLGNEMDGPWQIGHKTAEVYGALAAETAKAMRQVDPTIELVLCGSSSDQMPTFGAWEATVLDQAFDVVDYISLHAYFEPLGDDIASFLASAVAMDNFIDGVVATADHVAAKKRSRRKLKLSFDEWNVWYQERFAGHTNLEWAAAPRLIEDNYTALDAVVVGSLLMSLLRHADRISIACLAQLVNVIAPIRSESDRPAWRQTIFYPFALTARHARGEVLRTETVGDRIETEQHGAVGAVDLVATRDPENGEVSVFVVNRSTTDSALCTVDLRALPELQLLEHLAIATDERPSPEHDADKALGSGVPRTRHDARFSDCVLEVPLAQASWNLIRLAPPPK